MTYIHINCPQIVQKKNMQVHTHIMCKNDKENEVKLLSRVNLGKKNMSVSCTIFIL